MSPAVRTGAAVAFAAPRAIVYDAVVAGYDPQTRAAFNVMGLRYNRFSAAKDTFCAADRCTPEWYALADSMYRLGIRSTHAYYLWIQGHTRAVGTPQRTALRLVRA